MNKHLLIIGVGLLLLCTRVAAVDYFVATNGDDRWSGKLPEANAPRTDGPFASLERARDEVRRLKAAGPLSSAVTIQVRAGNYFLPRTFALEAQDSGTATQPVTYRGYQNERPVLIGGRAINGFKPYRDQILQADVGAQGWKDIYFRQLLFAGARQPLARYPNQDLANPYAGGWAYADGADIPAYKDVPGEDKRSFQYRSVDARTWAHPEEGEVLVLPRYNWGSNIIPIASVDQAQRRITLTADASYSIRPSNRYFVRNLFEELDAPGEWYLDRRTWTLYFWPPSPVEANPVYAPTMDSIVTLGDGAAHITLRNFVFEGCDGTAIRLHQASYCLIAANIIRNVGGVGGAGVEVSGGTDNGVVGNDISQTGAQGVILSGGDQKTLTAAGNFADNNYIHHIGVLAKQSAAISLQGIGNRASHNLIHDAPRAGIGFRGNNLVMEYNEVRHVVLETEDASAINTGGRDWISSRGSVIRHNFVHDVLGYGYKGGKWLSPYLAWGVYLDDNTGGVDVIGNIIARIPRAGVFLHNGRDNHIENNILVDNTLQQLELYGWTKDHVYWKRHLPTMIKGYESVANEPAWKKMRNMHIHPTQAPLPNGLVMTGDEFQRNIVYYRDPQSRLFSFTHVPFDHYKSDFNLVYHAGQPLLTGWARDGKDVSPNLVPNPSFTGGGPEALPAEWQWQVDPTPPASRSVTDNTLAPWQWQSQPAPRNRGGMVDAPDGARALRIEAQGKTPDRDDPAIVVSAEFPLQSTHFYRIRATLRATSANATARLLLQWYDPSSGFFGFWGTYPRDVAVGTEWKQYEFVYRILGPGDLNYRPEMKQFRLRLDFPENDGALLIRDVSVHEIGVPDEWASWQGMGLDTHSLVADPLFMNPAKDDYRLRPDSPAFALGFKAIPIEKIGPYADPLRATWPIVQAEGARENPLRPPAH